MIPIDSQQPVSLPQMTNVTSQIDHEFSQISHEFQGLSLRYQNPSYEYENIVTESSAAYADMNTVQKYIDPINQYPESGVYEPKDQSDVYGQQQNSNKMVGCLEQVQPMYQSPSYNESFPGTSNYETTEVKCSIF